MNEFRIVIEGLKELTDAVRLLAGTNHAETANTAAPVSSLPPIPQDSLPVLPNYGQVPVLQTPPAGQTMPQNAGMMPMGGVPTTAVTQDYTLEQLQVAAAGLSSMGKMPQVMGVLQQFGIQAMTELPKERYGEFAAALRGAGAQI